MVSYVAISGATAPTNEDCFAICDKLERCAGVEIREDSWCELQIPTLTLVTGNDRQTRANLDWGTGADAADEASLIGSDWNRFYAVSGSPAALTVVQAIAGLTCWQKRVECSAAQALACEAANRYPCEESYVTGKCGPCIPLTIAKDGSDSRLPGDPQSPCVPDPAVKLPTLKIALGSPYFGGQGRDEALYLAMIYGVKKAWEDGSDLIPIKTSRRMVFPINISGHTSEWEYTLGDAQRTELGYPGGWMQIENHPMAGLRAMSSLRRDEFTTQYSLMEPDDADRTRPHCVLGSSSTSSPNFLWPHTNIDLPLSHAATFFETPVLGWAFQSKVFADTTQHSYYLRTNRVGLKHHAVVARLMREFRYTRVGVVTPGVTRAFVRGLKEALDSHSGEDRVTLLVEDLNLVAACNDVVFEASCHKKIISALVALRNLDVRIVVHEQGGTTQLDSFWVPMAGLLRNDVLYIQVNVQGECQTPMLPPTSGEYGLEVIWESIRKSSSTNNAAEWKMIDGNDCRVCPNWAFRYGLKQALANKSYVAGFNMMHATTLNFPWSSWCPEAPTEDDILGCSWCDPEADFWISPSCASHLADMRKLMQGSMCIGVLHEVNSALIQQWTAYLANLSAGDLLGVGAPLSFVEIFN
eukprot:TRINITY_DN17255_c0_g1_i1.p1 TRINITY_DN17255_c0_g1~~TRINITY_DN17255_c0_g1_i1.p1  ORF type:complete len:739 (+),score=67.51 TRINITY_DN17255_c0_g1_i1:303-2219(+)